MAQLLLKPPRYIEAGITQVFGNGRGKLARNAVLFAAIVGAALAFTGKPQAAIDIAIRSESGHALLQLGSASISVAFDFGQECPNSNACAGALL